MIALLGVPLTAEGCSGATPVTDAATPATGEYLLWQAPGGFAGTGPAVEVHGSGIVNLWTSTDGLTLHQATGWDVQIQLSGQEIDELFLLLANVDFASLPHPINIGVECYQRLELEPCSDCEPIVLEYELPDQLRPEMNEVYAWFDEKLANQPITPPSEFCAEMLPAARARAL
jgi:hypothetical protein